MTDEELQAIIDRDLPGWRLVHWSCPDEEFYEVWARVEPAKGRKAGTTVLVRNRRVDPEYA